MEMIKTKNPLFNHIVTAEKGKEEEETRRLERTEERECDYLAADPTGERLGNPIPSSMTPSRGPRDREPAACKSPGIAAARTGRTGGAVKDRRATAATSAASAAAAS